LLEEIEKLVYPRQFSPALQDLLKRMLVMKPDERPDMMQLQEHLWLRGLKQHKHRPTTGFQQAMIKECGALEIDAAQLTVDLEADNPISSRRSIHRRHSAAERRSPSSRERDTCGCLLGGSRGWWRR
jgi:serine/threonine protein kinase